MSKLWNFPKSPIIGIVYWTFVYRVVFIVYENH